jgi:hypothetical protein
MTVIGQPAIGCNKIMISQKFDMVQKVLPEAASIRWLFGMAGSAL